MSETRHTKNDADDQTPVAPTRPPSSTQKEHEPFWTESGVIPTRTNLKWPEDAGEFCSSRVSPVAYWNRWTYGYMSQVLRQGARQHNKHERRPLQASNLYDVPQALYSRHLVSLFHQAEKREAPSRKETAADDDQEAAIKRKKERELIWKLWKTVKGTFIAAGVCQFIATVCQVIVPLLVREILRILEEHPGQVVTDQALPYALGLFVALLVNALATHRHRHLAIKSGVAIRAALSSIIYHHVLHLTPEGRSGLTGGVVSNLVGVDTQKLYDVTQEGNLIWSLPFSIVLVTIFLITILGPR
jgi:ABC transporter transmembrane region